MIFAEFKCFVRSLFLQTLWNFERMQNIGFAFGVAPLLKRVYSSRASYTAAIRRHTGFFNTHPYFAPIVMGVVYHREKQRLTEGADGEDAALAALKNGMGGAFGAVGDHVLWGIWRPFCLVLSLSIGLMVGYSLSGSEDSTRIFDPVAARVCGRWWIAGFLGMFNAVHLWLRWRGLQKACQDGPLVVRWIQSLSLQSWAAQVQRVALILLFMMALIYLSRWTSSNLQIWMIAVLLGAIILKRWSCSGTTVFYTVCALSILMTKLGIHWP